LNKALVDEALNARTNEEIEHLFAKVELPFQ